jgi:hypothetical protein
MLNNIPMAPGAANASHVALRPASELGCGQAAEFPGLPKPPRQTTHPLPGLASASFDFALRLFLYWGMACVLRKIRAQDRIEPY